MLPEIYRWHCTACTHTLQQSARLDLGVRAYSTILLTPWKRPEFAVHEEMGPCLFDVQGTQAGHQHFSLGRALPHAVRCASRVCNCSFHGMIPRATPYRAGIDNTLRMRTPWLRKQRRCRWPGRPRSHPTKPRPLLKPDTLCCPLASPRWLPCLSSYRSYGCPTRTRQASGGETITRRRLLPPLQGGLTQWLHCRPAC